MTRGSAAVEALLKRRHAVLEGHFELSSGLHSGRYVQCARLFESPADGAAVGRALGRLAPDGRVDAVVSPALGGILAGYEAARRLRTRFLFAERKDGELRLRRGFSLKPGSRVVVVEDVLTTGGSSLEVIRLVEAAGASVTAVLSVIDRGRAPARLGVPVKSLVRLPLAAWPASTCPLCREGKPLDKPGSRPAPRPGGREVRIR